MSQQLNLEAQHQYKDFVVHCKRQPYDVYVGRKSRGAPPGDLLCEWGNPFNMKNQSQAERNRVVHEYRCWLVSQPNLVQKAQKELKGKILACWCSPKLCHGHVLAEIANSPQYAVVVGRKEEMEDKKIMEKEETLNDEDFPTLGATTTTTRTKKATSSVVAKKSKSVPSAKKTTNNPKPKKQTGNRRRKRGNKTTTGTKVA